MAKKLRSFEALLRRIVAVPKDEVEARMAQKKAARLARKKPESTDGTQDK